MLAGSLLYDISGKGIDQAGRLIREQDAIPLVSVNKLCRVDVETIIAKALEKDKARLYETTADPAGDIDCYLTDRPIRARLPGTGYQLQKIGAATVLLALVARTAVRICEAIQARRAQQSAQAANDFLKNDLLAQASVKLQANTNNRADPDLKVRTTFDRAAQRINGKFGAQPRGFGLVLPVEEQLPSIGDPMPCHRIARCTAAFCYIGGVMESRVARTGTVAASQPVMLSVLRSNQVDLGGLGRLDGLARPRGKAFGFMQVVENNPERE